MPVILLVAILMIATARAADEEPPLPLPSTNIAFQLQVPEIVNDFYLNLEKREQLWWIFSPEVTEKFWIPDFSAIKNLWKERELVEIPDHSQITGVSLRKSGLWPIGEKADNANRHYYYGLRKPAAGLLYKITDHMRHVEGKSFKPYEVTSMVRSWEYQKLLLRTNRTADVIFQNVPPTHAFGLAFDITRINLSKKRQQVLEKYLIDLSTDGLIIYFKEISPQAAFHVIALPHAAHLLEAYYVDSTETSLVSGAN